MEIIAETALVKPAISDGRITLNYYAKDIEHDNAAALKEYLSED